MRTGLILLLAVVLVGCGVKGDPITPDQNQEDDRVIVR